MAKGQKKSHREAKKPKAAKKPAGVAESKFIAQVRAASPRGDK